MAKARNGAIGRSGALPWHVPADLARFRQLTLGKPVIMGRRTWESLPERFRPLPQRRNIVVTRRTDWQAPGAELAHSLDEALARVDAAEEAFIIGGAELYRAALPRVERAYVTEIDRDIEGDTFFPELDPTCWQRSAVEHGHAPAPLDCPIAWVVYDRRA